MCQIIFLNNGIGEPTWGLTVVCFLKFYIFQLVLVLFVMISNLRFHFAFIILAMALQAEAVHKQPRWEIQSKFSKFKGLENTRETLKIGEKVAPCSIIDLLAGAPQWKQFLTLAPLELPILPSAFMVKKKFTEHLAKISFLLWRQYYKGTYHGTFSLAVEASPHCPKTLGFTGLENSSLGDQSHLRPVTDIYMYICTMYIQ